MKFKKWRPFRSLAVRAARAFFGSSEVHGLPVIFGDPSLSRSTVLNLLEDTLHLLQECDPRRYQRILRYTNHIAVWPGHHDAYDRLGGMLISTDRFSGETTEALLGALVHEATHGRLISWRVRHTKLRIARIERRCVEEQVDSMLVCGKIDAQTAIRLMGILESPWWTEPGRRAHAKSALESAGLPSWLAILFKRI